MGKVFIIGFWLGAYTYGLSVVPELWAVFLMLCWAAIWFTLTWEDS